MESSKRLYTVIFIVALLGITSVQAANVETPLPANTYITKDGLDWVWAYPYNNGHANFDLSYQSQFGWRLPTEQELANAPLATEFIFAGANVPLGGSDPVSGASFHVSNPALDGAAACATPYFSNGSWNHCDWGDADEGVWYGQDGALDWAEQLLVRGEMSNQAVPTLSTFGIALMVLALFGFAATRYRKV